MFYITSATFFISRPRVLFHIEARAEELFLHCKLDAKPLQRATNAKLLKKNYSI